MTGRSAKRGWNLGLEDEYSVPRYIGYFRQLNAWGHSGFVRYISNFQQPCISKTAGLRAKHTPKSLCYPVYVAILSSRASKPRPGLLVTSGPIRRPRWLVVNTQPRCRPPFVGLIKLRLLFRNMLGLGFYPITPPTHTHTHTHSHTHTRSRTPPPHPPDQLHDGTRYPIEHPFTSPTKVTQVIYQVLMIVNFMCFYVISRVSTWIRYVWNSRWWYFCKGAPTCHPMQQLDYL